jgi:hypothetical protein
MFESTLLSAVLLGWLASTTPAPAAPNVEQPSTVPTCLTSWAFRAPEQAAPSGGTGPTIRLPTTLVRELRAR